MEDTIIVGELKGRLFSVFDGHGGSSVSAYLERHLATAVEAALGEQSTYVCVCVCVCVCLC
jgi:serine/threonine protein phosphatase PrpC